eukprot:scaffold125756_cov16-Tisochrysis_lutea.AAC.1
MVLLTSIAIPPNSGLKPGTSWQATKTGRNKGISNLGPCKQGQVFELWQAPEIALHFYRLQGYNETSPATGSVAG